VPASGIQAVGMSAMAPSFDTVSEEDLYEEEEIPCGSHRW
jgi:hypothetical protein